MVRNLGARAVAASFALVCLAVATASAQNLTQDKVENEKQEKMARIVYARLQGNIRNEYQLHLTQAMQQLMRSGAPPGKIGPVQERMKQLTYNKAALMAFCIAEAEKDRGPNAPPLPPGMNLMVTTCVEIKLAQMQKFSDLAAYADFFFPERIASCAESARLPEREKLLPPYEFLELAEPRLFDFVRYTECLMPG